MALSFDAMNKATCLATTTVLVPWQWPVAALSKLAS
jgi:hypothetical protein